uniref:Uncharacterized protein n=1 Tax=viral metagenome TaxID=1070528 RepID=A0A6M3IZ75_9ZZZZ
MAPLVQDTLANVHIALARQLGDLAGMGTVASAYASSISTQDLIQQRSNQLRGHHLYFYGGAAVQQDRVINAFTPYSVAGQVALLTVLRPYVSGSTPSVNTTFLVHRLFSGTEYNQAIAHAVARAQRRQLTPKFDRSLVMNTLALNAVFAMWTNGAAVAPDSWTLTGTNGAVARESSQVYPNLKYSAKVTNGASQEAYLSQSLADYGRMAGQVIDVSVDVHCQTTNRVRIALLDGTNTWYSDYHTGAGKETLTISSKTLATAITQCTVQLRTETGAAIDAYWEKVHWSGGGDVYEYPLSTYPTGFVYVSEVWIEGDQEGVFNLQVPDDWWYIDRYTKRLVLLRGMCEPSAEGGKVIEVRGQAYAAIPSAETDTVDVDNSYVLARAAHDLLKRLPKGASDSEGYTQMMAESLSEAERLERRMSTVAWPNARPVEEL